MADTQLLRAKRIRKRRWCIASWAVLSLIAVAVYYVGGPWGFFSGPAVCLAMEAALVTGQLDELKRLTVGPADG